MLNENPRKAQAQNESRPSCLILPDAPIDLHGPVKAWEEAVEILTYEPDCLSLRRWKRPALLAVLLVSSLAIAQSPVQTIALDSTDSGRMFEGLGAASAGASSRLLIDYPEPQRSEILDFLFKPNFGASLQHLKVEIGADVNSTDGSEPSHMRTPNDHSYTRGYEWWLMEEARKRNPKIILDALPWGAPGWIGPGRLYSSDMANYVVDFLKGAESEHHLHIDYVGAWNERVYDGDYIKELARALKREGLTTKIVCCDAYPSLPGGPWAVVRSMQHDPELNDAIAVLGEHYPNEPHAPPTSEDALRSGKSLWSSEDQPNPGGGPFLDRGWAVGGRVLARQYISNYLDLKLTKTEIWSPITSYYDSLAAPHSGLMYANTPWSGHYDVQSTIWVTAHTTQFVEPGWQYLDHGSGREGDSVSYVSLVAPDKKAWSVILETVNAARPQKMTFSLKGSLSKSNVHVWETNSQRTFEKVADVAIRDGSFTYTFEPGALYSLTTTTGQGQGRTRIPEAAAFPLPYADDFESTALHHSPRFLADQDGAFETEACEGRTGHCLVQQIEQKPIPWMPLPNPFTLAGDANWRDYEISADIKLPPYGVATVLGRIDSADVFQDREALYPSAYVLLLHADGQWQLTATAFKKADRIIASGAGEPLPGAWHHVSLGFRADELTGSLDGKPLFSLRDSEHAMGQVGLGSNWMRVAFDNLRVAPR